MTSFKPPTPSSIGGAINEAVVTPVRDTARQMVEQGVQGVTNQYPTDPTKPDDATKPEHQVEEQKKRNILDFFRRMSDEERALAQKRAQEKQARQQQEVQEKQAEDQKENKKEAKSKFNPMFFFKRRTEMKKGGE